MTTQFEFDFENNSPQSSGQTTEIGCRWLQRLQTGVLSFLRGREIRFKRHEQIE